MSLCFVLRAAGKGLGDLCQGKRVRLAEDQSVEGADDTSTVSESFLSPRDWTWISEYLRTTPSKVQ